MTAFLAMPVVVTAVRFDSGGRTLPMRITWRGVSYYLDTCAATEMYSFRHGRAYYWLARQGNKWCVTTDIGR